MHEILTFDHLEANIESAITIFAVCLSMTVCLANNFVRRMYATNDRYVNSYCRYVLHETRSKI